MLAPHLVPYVEVNCKFLAAEMDYEIVATIHETKPHLSIHMYLTGLFPSPLLLYLISGSKACLFRMSTWLYSLLRSPQRGSTAIR
jgi:hypothetical protein